MINKYPIGEETVALTKDKYQNKLSFHIPLKEAFAKQTEKQVDAIKALDPSSNLKQIKGIFHKK